jgi:hypothetical protein
MALRYAGTCTAGETLAAGTRAFYDPSDRSVTCTDLEHAKAAGLTTEKWQGSPTSGSYQTVLSDVRRDTDGVVVANTRYGRRRGYEWTGSRCIDAPCCGCCD